MYHRGACVADLAAGSFTPEGGTYDRSTLQLVFSTTKGITAIAVAMRVERGLLDHDAPVATYWPEFAGGSVAFADPARDLAFAYAMNRMATNLAGDTRAQRLIDAAVAAAGT